MLGKTYSLPLSVLFYGKQQWQIRTQIKSATISGLFMSFRNNLLKQVGFMMTKQRISFLTDK